MDKMISIIIPIFNAGNVLLFDDSPEIQQTARAEYAIRCCRMIKKFNKDTKFRECYRYAVKEYRCNYVEVLKHDKDISLKSKFSYIAFAVSPKIYCALIVNRRR